MLKLAHHLKDERVPDRFVWGPWIWGYYFNDASVIYAENLEKHDDLHILNRLFTYGLANYQAINLPGQPSPDQLKKIEDARQDMLAHLRFIEAIGMEDFNDYMIESHIRITTLQQTRTVYEYLQTVPRSKRFRFDAGDVIHDNTKAMNCAKHWRAEAILCSN